MGGPTLVTNIKGPKGDRGPAGGDVDPEAIEAAVIAYLDEHLTDFLSSGGSVHVGEGAPPSFIAGAKVGDIYINSVTGLIYQLEEG